MRTPAVRRALLAVVACAAGVALAGGTCDVRATLAQAELLSSLRPELIDQCCACLARKGTGFPGASCTEAVLVTEEEETVYVLGVDGDGTVTACRAAEHGCATVGSGEQSFEDDDEVDPWEVPCLCEGNEDTCRAALKSEDGRITVPGACIAQVDRRAPCETACGGVLSFEPLAAP